MVLSVADVRKTEYLAACSGISYLMMMERAGDAAFKWLLTQKAVCDASSLVVLCGNGNNGGDGLVIARKMHAHFPTMDIWVMLLCGEPKTPSAGEMFSKLSSDETLHVVICDVTTADGMQEFKTILNTVSNDATVLDAVYGIGFKPPLCGGMKTAFAAVREKAFQTVVAIDIPSGMAADDVDPDAVVPLPANATVTFIARKRCLSSPHCGTVYEHDLGVPTLITHDHVESCFPKRPAASHKGTFGHVYAVCGSYGMAGAAMLCGNAAMRCGAGLVHILIPNSIYPIVASNLWEAVYHPLEETDDHGLSQIAYDTLCQTVVPRNRDRAIAIVGPGLSQNESTKSVISQWLSELTVPMVIDADGLNALSVHTHVWKAMRDNHVQTIITPHPAEAARLLCKTTAEVERDRFGTVKELAALCGGVAVLKGHHTLIADNATGAVYVNATGCSGLAKGGSGDVLAGMIASFYASGMTAFDAAVCAVYLHGLSAEQTASRLSESGMLPSDLLTDLARLLSHFEKRE